MITQRFSMTVALAAALLVPLRAENLEVDLQRAVQNETVTGDLTKAIEEYKKIVARAGSNRAVAAKALIHVAECYQKLGDAKSRETYELVAAKYADQKESAAQARANLGPAAATRTGAISTRRVWIAPPKADFYGLASPDGRYVRYTDWNQKGDLFLHDLAAGTNRRLTDTADDEAGGSGEYAEEAAFSRDSRQLAYTWSLGKKGGVELRVIELQGAGVPKPRSLVANPELKWIEPYTWSPDGKFIPVVLQGKDNTAQIALVSAQDGSVRVLKSIEWSGHGGVFFSPDGKYLAYDIPVKNAAGQREMLVLAVDGSRETVVLGRPGNDSVVGWSGDGRRLLFSSNRSGSRGLWALGISDGKPQGSPELLKSDFGNAKGPAVLGITSSGALYSAEFDPGGVPSDIYVAPFDFATGRFLATPGPAAQAFPGSNFFPSWSPDGKYLAYASMRGSHVTIGIRTMQTGQVREIIPEPNFTPSPGYFRSLAWSPDGGSFIAGARGDKHGSGIFRIDAQTGIASMIVTATNPRWATLAPDGDTLYYPTVDRNTEAVIVMKRSLRSGEEREIMRRQRIVGLAVSPHADYVAIVARDASPARTGTLMIVPTGGGTVREIAHADVGFPRFSPDGRQVAVAAFDPATKSHSVMVIPLQGGTPRELLRQAVPPMIVPDEWAPDGRSILVRKVTQGKPAELWRVPVDGSAQQKLEANTDNVAAGFLASPDGKYVVFQTPRSEKKPTEIWVTENFLPALTAKR